MISVSTNPGADVTNFTSFIGQCYSFSVHLVLFIILKIVLFACLSKELSLWWIFGYLVLLIGGLENEQSLTIFCWWQINTYNHTYKHISKEWNNSFCHQGILNHYKFVNLLCTYTIWLFTTLIRLISVTVSKLYG